METNSTECQQMAQLVAATKRAGLETEGLVLEAFTQLKQPLLHGNGTKATEQGILSTRGSLVSLVKAYRSYVSEAASQRKAWCISRGLNYRTLENVRSRVVTLTTKSDAESVADDGAREQTLIKLIFDIYRDHVWMYRGHTSLGYINIHSGDVADIDTSLLPVNKPLPDYIVCIPHETRRCLINFAVIDESLVTSTEAQRDFPDRKYPFLKELKVVREKLENMAPEALSIFSKRLMHHTETLINNLPRNINKDLVFLEPNFRELCLELYAPKDNIIKVKEVVIESFQEHMKKTASSTKVLPHLSEDTGVRVSIATGLEVKHVLLPQDVTEALVIQHKGGDVTEEDVKAALEKFNIKGLVKNPPHEGGGDQSKLPWGKVTFNNPDDADEAVSQIKPGYYSTYSFFLKPIRRRSAHKQSSLLFPITYCRRPYSNDIKVTYRNPDDPHFIKRLENLTINDTKFVVATKHPEKVKTLSGEAMTISLHCRELKDFDEIVYRRQLHKRLRAQVISVERMRKPFPASSSSDVMTFKHSIKGYIGNCNCVTDEDYDIYVPNPGKDDVYMTAYVNVQGTVDAEQLKSKLLALKPMFKGQTLSIPEAITLTEWVPRAVWGVVKEGIQMVKDTVQRRNGGRETVEDVIQKDGSHQVRINCIVQRRGIAVRDAIRKVIRPGVVSHLSENDVNLLRNRDGHAFLRRVMNHYGVHVTVRTESALVWIYGPPNQITASKTEIQRYLHSLTHDCDSWTVDLAAFKSGLSDIVSLIKDGLDSLRLVNGVKDVTLDETKALLSIAGSPDGYISAKKRLNVLIREMRRQTLADTDDIERLCSACFCPPREPVYRLRRCGHKYCDDCIKMHLNTAVTDRVFPVRCVRDGCTAGVTWHDLELIYDYNSAATQRLLNASVTAFVAANKDRARFCQTPDCRGIYRVTADGKPLTCNECERTWCTRCHVPYHTGVACVMYKLMHENAIEPKLKAWMLEDPSSRKMCPKCETGIEKVDGCNNVHCSNCKACICWKCLWYSSDSTSVYDHLEQKHGGVYG